MIQMQSVLDVADNSGAKKVMCIKVLGGSKRMIAHLGDIIVVSVKVATPNGKIKQGEVHMALIVRTKEGVRRTDGSDVRFDGNAVVLLSKQRELLATRVAGIVPRELRGKGFAKVVSLAEGVI